MRKLGVINSRRKFQAVLWGIGVTLSLGVSTIASELQTRQGRPWMNQARNGKLGAQNQAEKTGTNDQQPQSDDPNGRMRFERLLTGKVPPDAREKARQHVVQMKAAQKRIKPGEQNLMSFRRGGVAPSLWTWLGPGNIGGRIRSIIIHPTNTDTMWIGSVSGGVWRTDNGGASWQPLNDFMANLDISTMVMSPTNPDTMYAGTGEASKLRGDGIFKSENGGVKWDRLASTNAATAAECADPASCPWFSVNRLAISPDGNTLLAATGGGTWRSANGGTSWTQVGTSLAYDVDFDPTDSNKAIIGGDGFAALSVDGGQTFPQMNTTIFKDAGRVEIAYAPSKPEIVYASVDLNGGEVYQSKNGGKSYARVNSGNPLLGGQGGYTNIIWVNPRDEKFVIVAGVLPYRSLDSGTTFSAIGDSSKELPHTDHHMIVAHPRFNNTTNRTIFFSGDGGIFKFDDVAVGSPATNGWHSLNNNLGITQFGGAAANSAGVIVGGSQDNGNLRFSGNPEAWSRVTGAGGDGGYCAADPTDPRYFYTEYTYLQLRRSTDGGVSATNIFNGITDAGDQKPNPQRANFYAPFVIDPNNPSTMLAGGINLWRSTNIKDPVPTWQTIKYPSPYSSFVPITAIGVSPATSTFIVIGQQDGQIWRTFVGTSDPPIAWQEIDIPTVPKRVVTRLVIDSTRKPNPWIYATLGGFQADNIYRSTDLGKTWSDITGVGLTGLPDVPVRSLAIHPADPDLLYVGTDIGLFISEDAGATWGPTQEGPANVAVDDLIWMGGDLLAVTFGRGLYRASGGTYVDCNYTGVEKGSVTQPFRTVTSGVKAAPDFGIVWIRPCNYNESMAIPNIAGKSLELRSLGGTAVVGKRQ